MRPESELHPNRLISEKSPYLLQHACNPVDWYPWGEEAFEKARTEDKPIFLSVGYSTCHWCHVMETESFEDSEIANAMNETFVCIKVDREERPDIDKVYLTACQMMTGSAGWPLSIIMTTNKKPFFATTYVPKESIFGRIGMRELIVNIQKVWELQRDKVDDISNRVVDALSARALEGGEELDRAIFDKAFEKLSDSFDSQYGGFGAAPKFPTPEKLTFLLRYWKRAGNERALEMAEKTLSLMRQGGIFDHIGYGFHRYSTDRAWILPHFEKMLYDQAMLSIAYTEAYQVTKKEEYAETVHETLDYVLRELTSSEGAFFSAEDADSEGVEGRYYLWTVGEIKQVLSPAEAEVFARAYNVTATGNLGKEGQGNGARDNVLSMNESLDEIASQTDMTAQELRGLLATSLMKLSERRERRAHPHKDDKILTDWNGLMIVAFARAAKVFGRTDYEWEAIRATDFILNGMVSDEGRLRHRFRDGEAAIDAFLDDHAFMIWGLTELYETTFDVRFVQAAMDLTRSMIDLFWDEDDGGFFFSAKDAEKVVARRKESYDGALPSGNSVAMLCLLRLSHLTGDLELERKANRIAIAFAKEVSTMPEAYPQLLSGLDFAFGPSSEIIIAGDPEKKDTIEMIDSVRARFMPNAVVILNPEDGASGGLLAESIKGKSSIDGKATAYICSNRACGEPTNDLESMLRMLKEV